MKLVIDIPKEVYKCVMDGTYCGPLYEELKNSAPVDTRGDCISRQAVIDRINELIEVEKKQGTDDWGYGRERVNAYEAMLHFVKSEYLHPSVEPERKPEKCGDCISRQAAIEILDDLACDYESGEWDNAHSEARGRMINLPSVEPERKTGKWEYVQYDGNPKIGNWHCSNCRVIVNSGFEGTPVFNYCPICGTKMEVDG
jgi:hypothetical protein